ncbi:DMT family transporter [Saccharopolyspora terrae]|uniref:DMT family transporter n=1 Tax=Saccharopolyspora terrae TaxID=2530384 RepID=UPI001A9F265C|nr:DMT family transporter [Saccharopolyspora terrae]
MVVLLLLAVAALWGASFLFIRVAVTDFGPVALIETRVLLAGVALWLVLSLARRGLPNWRAQGRRYLVLGAVSAGLPFTLIAVAEQELTSGLAATLNATTPLFTLLIGALYGQEQLNARRLAGVLCGVVGVAVLVGLGPLQPSLAVLLAVAASLLAAVCYAIGGVYAKRHFSATPPITVATGQQLGAAAVLLPITPFAMPDKVPSAASAGAAIALALPCTALGFALFYRIVARRGPTTALAVTLLVPPFGLVWGAVFLREPLTPSMLVGLVIVLASVALITRRTSRAQTPRMAAQGAEEV